MKTNQRLLYLATFLMLVTTLSCSRQEIDRESMTYKSDQSQIQVGTLGFHKVNVTSYAFNETLNGRLVDGASGSFENVQSAFYISDKPITKAFYESYMGKGHWPKNGLCIRDVNTFLDKLYLKTNVPVIIPTEGMIEAAYKTGILTMGKDDELIASDGWTESRPPQGLVTDYKAPLQGPIQVLKTLYTRNPIEEYRRRSSNKFYLAIRLDETIPENLLRTLDYTVNQPAEKSDGNREVYELDGQMFVMVPVKGGKMTLGATPEQEKYAEVDEGPLREVIVEDFKICQTEVTVGLWLTIMGTLPVGNDPSRPNNPVGNVSFFRAQEFIRELNKWTEKQFRLPSEDEWEYAARGGNKTHNYIFAGSNNAQDVAVCSYKSKSKKTKENIVRPSMATVKSRKPNELGLYDMSGSQWEWVTGQMPDGRAIQKGGSWKSLNTACRVSNRQGMEPQEKKDTFGFRLAL